MSESRNDLSSVSQADLALVIEINRLAPAAAWLPW
jgi:hypothetical protein